MAATASTHDQLPLCQPRQVSVGAALGSGRLGGPARCVFHGSSTVLSAPPKSSHESQDAEDRRAARHMSLERLEGEEERTVHDWARAPARFGAPRARLLVMQGHGFGRLPVLCGQPGCRCTCPTRFRGQAPDSLSLLCGKNGTSQTQKRSDKT